MIYFLCMSPLDALVLVFRLSRFGMVWWFGCVWDCSIETLCVLLVLVLVHWWGIVSSLLVSGVFLVCFRIAVVILVRT